jgi:hypothetical protein
MAKQNPFAGTTSPSIMEIAPLPKYGSTNLLAELNQNQTARKNRYDELKRKFDSLERHADFLATRLEATQKSGNQGAYNAILQQLQNAETRISNLATEMNSIAESSRYSAEQERKQQRIDARKPKTTMDKVRESLPYAIGSGIRDMIVDTGKGLGQTALYAENAIRGSTLGKNDKGFTTLQLGKAGTQGSVMNPEDITMGDVAGEYATALGENTGFYGDVLNSMMHWRQGRLKPDSENEKYAKMFGGAMRDAVGTKPLEDDTVLKGARMVADPFAVLGGGTAVLKTGANAIDNFGDIAKGFRRGDGRYIPRDQLGAIDVWHGSPHDFNEFKANANLGKGEGAQAYGVGGYTAGSKDIAEYYKNSVKADVRDLGFVDGSGNEVLPKDNNIAWEMIDLADGDLNKAREKLANLYSRNPEDQRYISSLAELDGLIESGVKANAPRQQNLYKIRLAWNDAQKEASMPLSGDHFLDLDNYMQDQPQYILDSLKKSGYELKPDRDEIVSMAEKRLYQDADDWAERTGGDPQDFINDRWSSYVEDMESDIDGIQRNISGRDFYEDLVREFGYNQSLFEGKDEYARAVSDFLYQQGIAGNKFSDANLRIGKDGDYNYVNFSDDLATVLERNGVAINKAKK